MSEDSRRPSVVFRALALLLARLRFLLLVGGVLFLIAYWPSLRHFWELLVHPTPFPMAVSSETEYWCPMCPGVVSDWPNKCPVCQMTLVRRLKGEITPLPDGVVARVQLSPYRLMLAGINTSPVEFRKLELNVIAGGKIESTRRSSALLAATAFADEISLLATGAQGDVTADSCPGETFPARLEEIEPAAREARLRIVVEDPRQRLRPGHYAEVRFRLPAAKLDVVQDSAMRRWRDQAAAEVLFGGSGPAGLGAMFDAAVEAAQHAQGLALAVPESAVIDTGERKVVFIESMPGMYDAVEVRLGRRCGEHYPVISGLESGQRVVTTGAVLLDAETRLNPSVAAGYFGAGSRTPAPAAAPPGALSPEDRLLAQKQKICPVTEAPLDSMGGPVRVLVNGKPVFICCDGCRDFLLKEPAKYLRRIEKAK